MTAVADGIGIRATGIAGATLGTADLARARVFYIVRLGFPLLADEPDMFAFGAGSWTVTVRSRTENASCSEPSRRDEGIDGITLCCTGDELRRVADALTAAGIEHSGLRMNPPPTTEHVVFDDPDGIEWELCVR